MFTKYHASLYFYISIGKVSHDFVNKLFLKALILLCMLGGTTNNEILNTELNKLLGNCIFAVTYKLYTSLSYVYLVQ